MRGTLSISGRVPGDCGIRTKRAFGRKNRLRTKFLVRAEGPCRAGSPDAGGCANQASKPGYQQARRHTQQKLVARNQVISAPGITPCMYAFFRIHIAHIHTWFFLADMLPPRQKPRTRAKTRPPSENTEHRYTQELMLRTCKRIII